VVTRLLATLTAAEIKAFLDAFGLDIATKFLDDLTAGEVRELIGLSDPRAIAQFKAAALRSKNVAGLRSYLAGMRAKGKGSLQAGLIADAERAPKAPTPAHPSGPAVASLPAAFAAEARAWRDAGLEESVARLLGRADLALAFRQWMRDTLDVLNTARKDGRLADNKALRRLIGEMGGTGTDLATVGQDFSELENARYVLEHQALTADSPVVVAAAAMGDCCVHCRFSCVGASRRDMTICHDLSRSGRVSQFDAVGEFVSGPHPGMKPRAT